MEAATVELRNTCYAELVELYRRPISDTSVESQQLQRDIGRLVKIFVQDL